MPRRPPPGKKLPAHRPIIPIDWAQVDKMVLAGLSGTQIAGILDVHSDTFYERFRLEKGVPFSEYRPRRKEGGDGMIMLRQFKSALNGNTAMLKLLGEERLGQGKKEDIDESEKRDLIRITEKYEKLVAALQSGGISVSDFSDQQSVPHQGCTGEEDQVRDELGSTNTMEGETQL